MGGATKGENAPLLASQQEGKLSRQGFAVLACASLSCFVGGTMYSYGVWSLGLKQDTGLSQLQTNVLAGVIFSGGSFLTNQIIYHCSVSLKWAGLCPGVMGAVAYLLLGLLPVHVLTFWPLLALIALVGYAVMGLFICAIQAINWVNKTDGFNTNVGTAIAQSSYGLGCMAWVCVLQYCTDGQWQAYCITVAAPFLAVGVLCFFVYPRSRDAVPGGGDAGELDASTDSKLDDGTNPGMSPLAVFTACGALLVLYLFWYGSAIALQTTAGTLMQSMGQTERAVEMTILFGVGQTCGRLSSLWFAVLAKSRGGSGTAYRRCLLWQPAVGVTLLIAIHLALVLHDTVDSLVVIIALTGVPYGLSWTSLFHSIDALFDSDDTMVTLGMVFGPGLGPVIFDTAVGLLYDAQLPAGGTVCTGAHCFKPAFQMLLGFDCATLGLVLLIYWLISGRELPLQMPPRGSLCSGGARSKAAASGSRDASPMWGTGSLQSAEVGRDFRSASFGMERSSSSLQLKRNNSSFILLPAAPEGE
jgi:hypothetical protein